MSSEDIPLIIPKPFLKVFKKKPPELQGAILECIKRLSSDPKHPGLRVHRVLGCDGVFEARIDRGNRLTFHYQDGAIVLRNNCNHAILNRSP